MANAISPNQVFFSALNSRTKPTRGVLPLGRRTLGTHLDNREYEIKSLNGFGLCLMMVVKPILGIPFERVYDTGICL